MNEKIFAFLSVCLMELAASAQQKADIEVSYTEAYISLKGKIENRDWRLLANSSVSKFYNPMTWQLDSISSTPEGCEKLGQLMSAELQKGNMSAGVRPSYIYVYQNIPERSIMYYDQKCGDAYYQYAEPWDEQHWEISDSTKTIIGYECVMAAGEYHGRQWTVWFAPEIPLSVGPWKFCGLPGLILEAADSKGEYSWTADGIVNSTKDISPVYKPEQYAQEPRKAMLRKGRTYLENPLADLEARLGLSLKNAKIQGEIPEVPEDWDWYESDYR